MRKNKVKDIWAAGGEVVTGWLGIPSSISAELMAQQGWDALTIDLQHGATDYVDAVPMLQAIKLTGETAGNVVVEESMEDVYASVKRGGSIAVPIAEADVFPPMVGHMVAVGEETGQLDEMLSKVADFYEAEVDAKVKALTALLEPVMIVFVGGMVGFIVISMYLPMFSIYEHIR